MINPQWLELPISRTNFHGPKDVRAIYMRYMIPILPKYTHIECPDRSKTYPAFTHLLDDYKNKVVYRKDLIDSFVVSSTRHSFTATLLEKINQAELFLPCMSYLIGHTL